MPFTKGNKHGHGRKGAPNKATADVRACIALIAQRHVGKLEEWISQIDDPAKRAAMLLDLFEYHIPKLARTELTGQNGGALLVEVVNYSPPK